MVSAYLDSLFFNEHAPSLEFFQKWKDQGPWDEQFLPVYEWQGQLFVAVASGILPSGFEVPANFVFVQADGGKIRELWQKWQTPIEASGPPGDATAIYEPLELKDDSNPQISEVSSDEEVSAPVEVAVEVPEGFDFVAETLASDQHTMATQIAEMPEGISLEHSTAVTTIAPATSITTIASVTNTPAEAMSDVMSEDTPIPLHAMAAQKANPAAVSANWTQDIFSKLNPHFSKSMVILVQGNQGKGWRWNEGFTPAVAESPLIDLSAKSPFYVVCRTKKPYHGPVIPNDLIKSFCQQWTHGRPLMGVTIVPLIQNNSIFGMLLMESEEDQINIDKLHFAEKIAKEVETTLSTRPDLLAA